MVGYTGPCPCCSGVKRRRAEMGSSESFPSPGSLPDTPPAKIPRFSSESSAASASASAADAEREEKAAKPAPAVVGPDQEDKTNAEAASTEAVAAVEAVKAAAVLSGKSTAEAAEQAVEPASANLVPAQEAHAMALLEAAIGEEEQVADEAEKADEPAATPVPEQEPETKASPEAAVAEVTAKQESDDKAMPEAAISEKAELASPLALSDSDHGCGTRQGPETSVTAAKASGENRAAEEAASPAPAKAKPRLTAEVRMPKGVHVDISFRCKCGGLCRDIAIA